MTNKPTYIDATELLKWIRKKVNNAQKSRTNTNVMNHEGHAKWDGKAVAFAEVREFVQTLVKGK